MTRTLVLGMLATMMLTLVPLAVAEDNATPAGPAPRSDEGGDGSATYGSDCPPDMYCINSASSSNETGTCMDGQQGNETCDPHVYYMTPPGGAAANGSAAHGPGDAETRATSADAPAKTVPALAGAGVAVAAALAVALVGRRAK